MKELQKKYLLGQIIKKIFFQLFFLKKNFHLLINTLKTNFGISIKNKITGKSKSVVPILKEIE